MGRVGSDVATERKNFLVSHAGTDAAWAEWVAWQLIEAGYTVELDLWDWAAGQNFITKISDALDGCERVVALWSMEYFTRARYTTEEWSAASVKLPGAEHGRLVPLRVEDVPTGAVPGILRPLLYRDLFGLAEDEARQVLQAAVRAPARPGQPPVFPGRGTPRARSRQGEPAPRLPNRFPPVWNIPAHNPRFTGRDELLRDVRSRLRAGEKTVVQALQGMGGVGKTQVAIEYAHRFARTYDLAWWVASEQPALIGDQFAALADELDCVGADGGTKRIQAAVLRELRQRDGWLLVFDNAEDPEDLREWLPSGNGHVLITSRTPGWGDIATSVEIDVLARAESVAILRERVPGLGEAEADQLAERLGDLPLAMAQAAGFMAESGTTAARYLTLLETRTREAMGEGRPRSYLMSLAAATSLSADQLAGEDPAAAELANLCAFLAPEPIPQEMLTSAAAELPAALASLAADPLAWGRTLTQLGHVALARIDQGQLQMHRLTQAILRDTLTPDQAAETRDRTEAILAASDPGDPANPATWPRWAPLMPHLLAADLAGTGNPELRSTACNACWYLLARGDAHSCHDLASLLYQRWLGRLGADDPDTLMMASYLAWALEDLGDYRAARDLGEDTLVRRRRVLGEGHPSTLVTASNLVATLAKLGDLEAARNLAEDTLERSRRALGEDDSRTLLTATNLAAVLQDLGQAQAALELGEDVLGRRRRVLGEDYPNTLVSAGTVAASLRAVGALQAAQHLGEDTLSRMRRVLGDDHPITLAMARDLVVTLRALGEKRDAQNLAEDTLRRMRLVLGEDHPDALAAARTLAADQSHAEDSP
jgi:tetratricopeptide (TPR) repeat protein